MITMGQVLLGLSGAYSGVDIIEVRVKALEATTVPIFYCEVLRRSGEVECNDEFFFVGEGVIEISDRVLNRMAQKVVDRLRRYPIKVFA